MKRKMILCLVIAFSGLLVSAANASLLPTGFVGNVKTNATGEPSYWIQVISGNVGVYEGGSMYAAGDHFNTFCLEGNEGFPNGKGGQYYFTFSTVAQMGGRTGAEPALGGDPLDERTAWLYTQYIDGNPLYQKVRDNQNVAWYIEGEIKYSRLSKKQLVILEAANAAILPGGSWYGKGLANVKVVNVWANADGTGAAQSFLFHDTNGIPEPATIAILGLGALVIRRKKIA